MNRSYIYIYILLSIMIFLASCDEEEISLYDSDSYIYFKTDNESEFIHSFSLTPGVNEASIPAIIELIGKASDKDREIKYKILEDETTALTDNYEMPQTFIFGKGKYVDTLYIKVKNTAILKSEVKDIVIQLIDSKDFQIKISENSIFRIKIHDKLSKPGWWDSTVESEYLGDYSDEKFTLFITVTGIADFSNLSDDSKRAYCLQFKYYLKQQKDNGQEVLENDGSPMEVPIVG